MPLLLPFPPSWRFFHFISLSQILNLSTHGLHFFLGGFPFSPDSHTSCPGPPSWDFLFLPGYQPLHRTPRASSFLPDSHPLLRTTWVPPLSFRIPAPCPGLLGGSTYFYCSGYKTQVFSGSLPHASLMIPVRQSLDKGQKVVCQKCAAFQRRVVATLGAVLNDNAPLVRFAARRTTNREGAQ